MTAFIYNEAKKQVLEGTIIWTSQTFKAMLVGSSYTPNADDLFVSSIGAAELSGSGYVAGFGGAGRKTIAGKVVTKDDTEDRAYLNCSDFAWVGINAGTVVAAIIIQEVTTDADSKLVAYLPLGAALVTDGSDILLQVPTKGWVFI